MNVVILVYLYIIDIFKEAFLRKLGKLAPLPIKKTIVSTSFNKLWVLSLSPYTDKVFDEG